jgi:hypothetical protein
MDSGDARARRIQLPRYLRSRGFARTKAYVPKLGFIDDVGLTSVVRSATAIRRAGQSWGEQGQ